MHLICSALPSLPIACRLAGTLKPRGSYTLKDVPASAFIEAMSEHLKRKGTVTVPEWAEYAKTSCECPVFLSGASGRARFPVTPCHWASCSWCQSCAQHSRVGVRPRGLVCCCCCFFVSCLFGAGAQELAPLDEDWMFVRMAALVRKVYLYPYIGVGTLARMFGGAKKRGHNPLKFQRASRKVIRYALTELAKLGLIEVVEDHDEHDALVVGGRVLTSAGRRDCDLISREVGKKIAEAASAAAAAAAEDEEDEEDDAEEAAAAAEEDDE